MSAPATDDDIEDHPALLPFRRSRLARRAHLDRTRQLLSALDGANGAATTTILTLPNNLDDDDEYDGERRPTSTYVVRPISEAELDALLDPSRCNCRLVSDHDGWAGGSHSSSSSSSATKTRIAIMYRVAGNGEGPSMSRMDVSSHLASQIRDNRFAGRVLLGVLLDGPDAVPPPVGPPSSSSLGNVVGVSDNGLIRDSILEPGCSVHRNVEISDTHVAKRASVIGCGSVSCPSHDVVSAGGGCNFDMSDGSMDVELGPEAGGGRVSNVRVECTMIDVCRSLNMDSHGGTASSLLLLPADREDAAAAEMVVAPPTAMNVLCPMSSVLHTPRVRHVHLLPRSSIDSATSVTSSILLPYSTIRDGCTVMHALLQWNSKIASHTDARRVLLMERAEVGPHSFTANSIYGPDSHVSGGEVHCTLFGPNANSHHQSLLIGILWPLGRGNVGYGSNVGSNHTGRIPDQETSVGEGTFWGLGCVIKFPVDLTSAPYSIIAAGVQLPPQRITFPFSLITDGPGGMNQLTPGWLLQYSPYTIARSEVKFANRRTARRHDFYTGWKILRGGVMDMMSDARDALASAGEGQQRQSAGEGGSNAFKKVYKTDRAVVGLGANQLTEQGRLIGMRAYTSALQRYALRGLLDRLVGLAKEDPTGGPLSPTEGLRRVGLDEGQLRAAAASATAAIVAQSARPSVNWPVLPWNEADASWEHQRGMLLRELPSILLGGGDGSENGDNNGSAAILSALLRKCVELEDDHAKRVYDSKSRDDVRGAATVPGYRDVHVSAESDPVVLMTRKDADDVRRDVRMVENALGGGMARSRL